MEASGSTPRIRRAMPPPGRQKVHLSRQQVDLELGPSRPETREADVVTSYDIASFTAGKDAGTRVSACVARLAAAQLVEDAHWWNRRRCRLMARALVTCADELEDAADESRAVPVVEPDGKPVWSPRRIGLAG